MEADSKFTHLEDLFSPLVRLRIYTTISYIFPLPDRSQLPGIIKTVRTGYETLHSHLPWLTGQIVIQPASSNRCAHPIVRGTTLKPASQRIVQAKPMPAAGEFSVIKILQGIRIVVSDSEESSTESSSEFDFS